jgi:hypothetical protein
MWRKSLGRSGDVLGVRAGGRRRVAEVVRQGALTDVVGVVGLLEVSEGGGDGTEDNGLLEPDWWCPEVGGSPV